MYVHQDLPNHIPTTRLWIKNHNKSKLTFVSSFNLQASQKQFDKLEILDFEQHSQIFAHARISKSAIFPTSNGLCQLLKKNMKNITLMDNVMTWNYRNSYLILESGQSLRNCNFCPGFTVYHYKILSKNLFFFQNSIM